MPLFINDEQIADVIIEQEAARMRPQYFQAMEQSGGDVANDKEALEAQLMEWARENVTEQALLRQAAREESESLDEAAIEAELAKVKQSYGGEEQFAKCMDVAPENLEQIRRDIADRQRVSCLISKLTGKVGRPKKKDIEKYYKKNQEHFIQPEMFRARHVVKHTDHQAPTPIEGDEALAFMKTVQDEYQSSSEDFAAICDKYSDCSGNGGDLGWFTRGQMVESFEEVVFNLQPGKVSEIFQTEFGYHIAQLTDYRAEQPVPLEQVEEDIANQMMKEKCDNILENFVDGLKAKASIRYEASR